MASGYSRRMNQNKLFLKYKGKTLIEIILDTLSKVDFSEKILVAREKEILQLGENSGFVTIENKHADKGMSESIKLGVKASNECDGYMFFTGDQPLLDENVVNRLMGIFYQNPGDIIVPQYKGRRGSPVVFSKKFRDDLLGLEGDTGGKVIINKYLSKVRFVEIDDEKSLFDVDTKEDYEKLLKWDGAAYDI
ncbi:MAG: molybdenum cofactor cytidylyltransferase [Marinisporobacter sp.]|nr:molybdenum cofactor cytidylyltransferase [Marinisporobacter sp.]